MTITIHRGTKQIGGCITEIATANTRILIDLGSNLPGNDDEVDEFASKEAVAQLTKGVNAIFYTHYHGDHIGLFPYVDSGAVRQFIGPAAKEIEAIKLRALLYHDPEKEAELQQLESFETFEAGKYTDVGDIKVMPLYTSHSAFDAYMFVIEADGKRILHTGDFRAHGYLGKAITNPNPYKNVLQRFACNVDVLIMEGTMLHRKDAVVHESEISNQMAAYMQDKNYVFVLCSSTDVDRIISAYSACQKTRRMMLADRFQHKVIYKVKEYAKGENSILSFKRKIYYYHLNKPSQVVGEKFCGLVRPSQIKMLSNYIDTLGKENCYLIYSAWQGYYNENLKAYNEDFVALRQLFDKENIINIHTSGHADRATLERVIEIVQPKEAIIGIHKESNASLKDLNLSEAMKAKIVGKDYCPDYIKGV